MNLIKEYVKRPAVCIICWKICEVIVMLFLEVILKKIIKFSYFQDSKMCPIKSMIVLEKLYII